jgi:GH24 family phage-related lysozyme (muramidase)
LWGACAQLSRWNKARVGGVLRVVRGLDNRRKAERSLCEAGLLR